MSIPSLTSPAMLAVQEKVNMLQKQGMPMGQISQVLQNEVLPTGAVPISQLWQLMNYVKANAAKSQAPPTDSVAMQLARQVQQVNAQKHPMAQQGGVPPTHPALPVGQGGPPVGPPPQGAPPPPGVAGLPQAKVGQPGMAGGGIVAFDDGGQAAAPQLSPDQQALVQRQMIMAMRQRQAVDAPAHPVMNPTQGMAKGGIAHFVDGGQPSDWQDAGTIAAGVGKDALYGTAALLNQPGNAYDWLTNKTDQGIHALADYYRQPGAMARSAAYQNQAAALNPQHAQPSTQAPAGPTGPQNFAATLQARQQGNPTGFGAGAPSLPQAPPPRAPTGTMPAGIGSPAGIASFGPPSAPAAANGSAGGASMASHVSSLPGVLRNGPVLGNGDPLDSLMDKVDKPLTIGEAMDQIMAAGQKYGVGAAVKAFDAFLDTDQALLEKNTAYGKKIALANAGFAMAERASLRGGDPGYGGGFMGALAAGGGQLAKDLIANKDKAQAAQQNIAKLRFEAAHAAEQDVLGVVKDSVVDARAQAMQYHASMQAGAALYVEVMKAQAQLQHDKAYMSMFSNKAGSAENEQLEKYYSLSNAGKTAEAAQVLEGIKATHELNPSVLASQDRVAGQQGMALDKALLGDPMILQAAATLRNPDATPQQRARATAQLQAAQALSSPGGIAGLITDTGEAGPPPQIQALLQKYSQ